MSEPGRALPDLQVFDSKAALSRAIASRIAARARESVERLGRFTVALAGGGTPRETYRLLATELRAEIPWEGVHLFWSDERLVPPDAPDSNVRMVMETLLSHVPIPDANVHAPQYQAESSARIALDYETSLRGFFHPDEPRFDWMFLGMGEDGHVASLFPHSQSLAESKRLVLTTTDSPKPPAFRTTMSLALINASHEIHVLVAGRSKQPALAKALGPATPEVPASLLKPSRGTLHWWVDRDARFG